MTHDLWNAVNGYLSAQLTDEDPDLVAATEAADRAGIPDIAVTPLEGRFLNLLARISGARTILEIGTLAGYSTIWLARALPSDGRLVSLERDARNAGLARENVDRAGLSSIVDIRVGAALDSLPPLRETAPFDFVFIDADKANNPAYFRWTLELTRPGSVLVVDNVVRAGAVADPESQDPSVRGTRELFDLIAAEPRVDASALQTVGPKGHDGFLLALITG